MLVIFELDKNEANGVVHPFCDENCYANKAQATVADIESRGFVASLPHLHQSFGDGTICEDCSKPV